MVLRRGGPARRGGPRFDDLYEPEDDGPKGFGGYGTVYRYRKRDTGEIVAVKTFTPRATRDDPEPLLRREVNILRDLSHPNIIALKDPTLYHEVDRYGMDIYRFVIECMDEELYEFLHDPNHLEGRPLTNQVLKRLRPQRLPLGVIKNIMYQIACGLQHMHSKNIAHRDLKLENVMRYIETGRVKLIDFGMARVLENNGDGTHGIGSKRYMAPEITDPRAPYSVRADIWSLGVTMFVLLARRYPFRDNPNGWPITDRMVIDGTDCFQDEEGQVALNLIRRMLELNQAGRYSITDILEHPWFASERQALETNESEGSAGRRTDELLLHVQRPSGEPLRVYLSKLNLAEVEDPSATIVVSSFRENVEIVPVNTSGVPKIGTWTVDESRLNRGGKVGGLGRMMQRLNVQNGQMVTVRGYSNYLCELDHGQSQEFFRSLWVVFLDGRQNRDYVWSVYGSLREYVNQIASTGTSHIIMSLVGYEKRGPDGNYLSDSQVKKMVQFVVEEVAGLALDASRMDNLKKLTIVAWEDLFVRIKDGFRLSGRANTLTVLNDPNFMESLIGTIHRDSGAVDRARLRDNTVLNYYLENLRLQPDMSPTSQALQMCYWCGRIGRHLQASGVLDGPSEMMDDGKAGAEVVSSSRKRETFIVDNDHAFDILARNQLKAEEQWMKILGPFDAAVSLQCVKYLLEQLQL